MNLQEQLIRHRRSLPLDRFTRSTHAQNYEQQKPSNVRVLFKFLFGEEAKSDKLISYEKNSKRVLIKKQIIGTENFSQVDFHVDRSIFNIEIKLTGECGNFIVKCPSRELLNSSERDRSETHVIDNIQSTGTRGLWSLMMHGSRQCNVEILAISSIDFVITLMTKHSRQHKKAYKVITNIPMFNKNLTVKVDGSGLEMLKNGSKDHITQIRFIDESGNDVILPSKITSDVKLDGLTSSATVLLNNKLPASQSVYVMVEGKDMEGNLFMRTIPQPITTSHVALKRDVAHDVIIHRGVKLTAVNISAHNYGLNDTFNVSVRNMYQDDGTLKLDLDPILLNNKEIKIIPIQIPYGYNTKNGQISEIIVEVRGTHPGSYQLLRFPAVFEDVKPPTINSLSIKGIVNTRFAETVMTSSMSNTADIGLEAKFDVMLPVDAFITNLTMKLNNFTIIGKVEEKEKAKKIYEKAKKHGKAAGHVGSRKSSTRLFTTSFFVEAGKNITFQVTYQQLLRKVKGAYKYAVILQPKQPVKNFNIAVHIVEVNPLKSIRIPYFDTGLTDLSSVVHPTGVSVVFGHGRKTCHVKYSPSIAQQTALSIFGLSGSFAVQYDVTLAKLYGDVVVSNGYFAHFFSPPNLPVIPKRVVFIIDKSGSMSGSKINEVKNALATILRTLTENDYFNVVYFDSTPRIWNSALVEASPSNIRSAISKLKKIRANGGTLMIPAFNEAFKLMDAQLDKTKDEDVDHLKRINFKKQQDNSDYKNMMVFLTDGQGGDNTNIEQAVLNMNQNRTEIHTIAFGRNADAALLEKISAFNKGTFVQIFDVLSASVQIQDFFYDISNSPIEDISIDYPANRINDVTRFNFGSMQVGSDIVWAGKLVDDAALLDIGSDIEDNRIFDSNEYSGQFNAHITGTYIDENIDIDVPINSKEQSRGIIPHYQIKNFSERLWAFLQIKELLRQITLARNLSEKVELRQKALNMSLQYNFVTPLTSIIVVLPQERAEIDKELRREETEKRKKMNEEAKRRKKEEDEHRRLQREEEERKFRLEQQERARKQREQQRLLQLQAQKNPPKSNAKHRIQVSSTKLSRSKGGFHGDPHFVIPINSNFNLCFNWNGGNKEIYNLFYDPISEMTINGELVETSAPEGSSKLHRTYISAIALRLPKDKYEVIIRPENITLFIGSTRNFTLPITSSITLSRSEIRLSVYDVTEKSAKLLLSVYSWNLHIFLSRNILLPHHSNHLDFYITSNKIHLMSQFGGIIGQFIRSNATIITKKDAVEGMVGINDRVGHVTKIERHLPESHEKLTCWNSPNNARDLMEYPHHHYRVKHLLAIPLF